MQPGVETAPKKTSLHSNLPSQTPVVAQSKIIGSSEVHAAIARLTAAIADRHTAPAKLLLLGIANGGVELARRLAQKLRARHGTVDISFHRDDIARQPIPKEFAPTQIPADVDGACVILVDDVLFSGRTVKAALDELFDHGRAATVELAVLVDRGGRRLPISADYLGLSLPTPCQEKIVVSLHATDATRDSIWITPAKAQAKI